MTPARNGCTERPRRRRMQGRLSQGGKCGLGAPLSRGRRRKLYGVDPASAHAGGPRYPRMVGRWPAGMARRRRSEGRSEGRCSDTGFTREGVAPREDVSLDAWGSRLRPDGQRRVGGRRLCRLCAVSGGDAKQVASWPRGDQTRREGCVIFFPLMIRCTTYIIGLTWVVGCRLMYG